MKFIRRLIESTFAVTMLLAATNAMSAGMQITLVDVAGAELPPGVEECLGEGTYLDSGQLQVMSRVETDRNGGAHFQWHETLKNVVLVAGDGTVYRAVGTTNVAPPNENSINGFVTGPLTVHQSVHNRLVPIGNSDAPQLVTQVVYQLTINANGDVSSDILRINAGCI